MLCGVLPPGLIQYCSQHSCVIAAFHFIGQVWKFFFNSFMFFFQNLLFHLSIWWQVFFFYACYFLDSILLTFYTVILSYSDIFCPLLIFFCNNFYNISYFSLLSNTSFLLICLSYYKYIYIYIYIYIILKLYWYYRAPLTHCCHLTLLSIVPGRFPMLHSSALHIYLYIYIYIYSLLVKSILSPSKIFIFHPKSVIFNETS